jgi:plastocyanin
MRAVLAAWLLLASLLVVPGDRWAAPAEAQAAAPTRDVQVKGTAFNPPVLEVVKGTKVIWTNEDSGPSGVHTATSDDDGATFDETLFPVEFSASALNKGDHTFDTVGVIKYHCEVHASMHGEIRVVLVLTAPIVDVSARDDGGSNRFDPTSLQINSTQKVNFTNKGNNHHNVVFEDSSVQGGDLMAGKSVVVSFSKGGVFRYRCQFHSAPDFAAGMHGEVRVAESQAKLPPRLAITSPTQGASVEGTVHVAGTVASGPSEANATGVQVRIGTTMDWADADLDAAKGTWMYMWDSTKETDGSKTIYARAPSKEIPEPTPVSIDVVVGNQAAGGGNGTASATPTSSGKGEGGGSPGLAVPAVGLALLAAVLLWRRR